MKFTRKVTLAFVALGLLLASLSAMMLHHLASNVARSYSVVEPARAAAQIRAAAMTGAIADGFAFVATRDVVEKAEFFAQLATACEDVDQLRRLIAATKHEHNDEIARISESCRQLEMTARASFRETETDGVVKASTLAANIAAADQGVLATARLTDALDGDLKTASVELDGAAGWASIGGGLGALVLSLLVGGVLSRHLGRSLSLLTEAARRVGSGDMQARVTGVTSRDEFGLLANAFNEMVDDLTVTKHRRMCVEAELRMTEERLARTQRLEGLGRMAGGVAHDFNNLLYVISANANLIAQEGFGPDAGEMLADVISAADQASRLTKQLLAFSGKTALNGGAVEPNSVVEESVQMLRRVLGARFKIEVQTGARGLIQTDRCQFEQVLLNLIINAKDAMPDGGTIKVSMADAEGLAHPDAVVLSVRDTGTGMSEETQVRLFEPFFTTKEQGRGTGLGLATVYGVVRQAGGTIEVHSKLGSGTEFLLYFPRQTIVSVPPRPVGVEVGGQTLLVVDDDARALRMTQRVLERAGFKVVAASGGEAALALVTNGLAYDAVVSDVRMPGMGGIGLARELEKHNPKLRLLFMTGFSDQSLDPRRPVVQKPFEPQHLVVSVRSLLAA